MRQKFSNRTNRILRAFAGITQMGVGIYILLLGAKMDYPIGLLGYLLGSVTFLCGIAWCGMGFRGTR